MPLVFTLALLFGMRMAPVPWATVAAPEQELEVSEPVTECDHGPESGRQHDCVLRLNLTV